MKRKGNLFEQLASFQNLMFAFKKARKGATQKRETHVFNFHLERELIVLKEQLLNGSY